MKAYFEIYRDLNETVHCARHENNCCDPHFHSNIEIVYVITGQLEVTVESQHRILRAGEAAISDSYDIHTYGLVGPSSVQLLIIPVELVGSFTRMMKEKTFAEHFLLDQSLTREIYAAMQKLQAMDHQTETLLAKGYLYEILGLITKGMTMVEKRAESGIGNPVRNMLRYLEKHFREPIQINDLAKQFGYHPDYLSKLWSTTLGCGFREYVNVLRSRYAADLIRNSDMALTDIAFEAGFGSIRTFYRAFNAVYNLTPADFRTKVREESIDQSALKFFPSRT